MVVYAYYPRNWRMVVASFGAALATWASLFTAAGFLVYLGLTIMALALAIRREVVFDPKNRTYRWRDGIWPLMPSRRGTFDDIRWVQIDAQEKLVETMEDPVRLSVTYHVTLVWKRKVTTIPWHIEKTDRFDEAAKAAFELAEMTNAPVVETAAMQQLRPELGPAVYDWRLLVPVENRPPDLASRMRG